MFDKWENIFTKLDVVTKPYGDKMQRVMCMTLLYVKRCLEYLVRRLSHNNVDETDATLSSRLSETGEPEGWRQVSVTTERTRLRSQDAEFQEEITNEKVQHNLKMD
ncbi:hypothetical protein M513_13505 [Trichuris suis]|uniref:Uncharacterized protein n=1 Tax=Trichuris suis TaxID=68888 RepID=A0A085LKW7_9BILA|nr:hypothetical protein M513_13505 [Trichuris suis]